MSGAVGGRLHEPPHAGKESRVPRRLALLVPFSILALLGLCAAVDEPEEGDGDAADAPDAASPFDNLKLPDQLDERKREHLEQAIRAFRQMRSSGGADAFTRDAEKRLKKAATAIPDSALPHYYLGKLYMERAAFKKATKSFESAVTLNPNFYEAYTSLAELGLYETQYDVAFERLDKALAIHPKYLEALELRGIGLILAQRLEEAEKALTVAKEAGSRNVEDWINMVSVVLRGPKWETTYVSETENYVVKTGVSQELADDISTAAELIRQLYVKAFPKIQRKERKYQVFVYADKAEYHASGGPQNAGGHYSPLVKTLNIYEYPKWEDTLLVLHHEGLHQFLDEFLESIPQWFNEGVADYFGPSEAMKVGGKNAMRIRPNWWRLEAIQFGIQNMICAAPSELMTMSRSEMYGEQAGMHYAQAWSIVYFCLEGRKAKYKDTLVNYFEALRKGASTDEAYERTWAHIDMIQFEYDWKAFIVGLDPKQK